MLGACSGQSSSEQRPPRAELEARGEVNPEANPRATSSGDGETRAESSPGDSASHAAPAGGRSPASDRGLTGAGKGNAVETNDLPVPLDSAAVELRATDGVVVHGVLYAIESTKPRPIVLLFHQAGSNAAEYGPIAPKLQALGYHALAIDQRSGQRRFGRDNLTVKAHGESTGFGPAYRDLQAALSWARQGGYSKVIAWGSSYSAALVFRLASEHPQALAALLAFSPGEYMGAKHRVAGWARRVSVPVFVTAAPGKEVEGARAIAEAVGDDARLYVPSHGVHGSAALHPSRNPAGHRQVWTAVEEFLGRAAPS